MKCIDQIVPPMISPPFARAKLVSQELLSGIHRLDALYGDGSHLLRAAMMAVDFPILVNYDLVETIASICIAIVATGTGLYLAKARKLGGWSIPAGVAMPSRFDATQVEVQPSAEQRALVQQQALRAKLNERTVLVRRVHGSRHRWHALSRHKRHPRLRPCL